MNQQNLSSFIWSVADLLRGDYKQSEYGKVILPFTVLRRLDCVLDGTKQAVLKEQEKPNLNIERIGALLTVKPPLDEQVAIVEEIERASGNYDTLIAEAERAIELLQERRTALISAAVTGKIDVRGVIETAAP
jgi:type I restriction-modification system DNA methylase subunit